jgi:hypothetical protein
MALFLDLSVLRKYKKNLAESQSVGERIQRIVEKSPPSVVIVFVIPTYLALSIYV